MDCVVRSSASRDSCLPRFLPCTWRVSTMNVVVLMLLLLMGSRAAPTSGSPNIFTHVSQDEFKPFTIPENLTISGPCLAAIVSELCNGRYYRGASTSSDASQHGFSCRGETCLPTKLHSSFCDTTDSASVLTQFSHKSAAQKPYGNPRDSNNVHPFCTRYMDNVNMEHILIESDRRICTEKIDCLCRDCCPHKRKRQHQDLHPLLKLFLRLFPQKNLSHAKREAMLKGMMEQKYKNLVPNRLRRIKQGRIFRNRQAITTTHSPMNVPLKNE